VPDYKYTLAFLGYGPEEDSCVVELTYNHGKTDYAKGNAYAQVRSGASQCMYAAQSLCTSYYTVLPEVRGSSCVTREAEAGSLAGAGSWLCQCQCGLPSVVSNPVISNTNAQVGIGTTLCMHAALSFCTGVRQQPRHDWVKPAGGAARAGMLVGVQSSVQLDPI
jgi:hypothetical protein